MHVTCCLHVAQDVVLKLRNRLKRIWHVLILLNVANHFGCLSPLGEVDEVVAFDDRGDTILNERQVCEIDACDEQLACDKQVDNQPPHTKERNTWWVGVVQGIPILGPCLCALHQLPHGT